MVLAQMVVDAVELEGRSLREVAAFFGVSKSWVHKMVQRHRSGGPEAFVARSRAPRRNPNQMSMKIEDRVVRIRKELVDLGADAGAQTISVHLASRYGSTPSVSAIYRALKRFLAKRPCESLEELQRVLDEVVGYYNEQRPHRSRNHMTPAAAWAGRSRAEPFTLINEPHRRIRRDVVDNWGKVSLRYLGEMRHLNVGYMHRGERVRLYICLLYTSPSPRD